MEPGIVTALINVTGATSVYATREADMLAFCASVGRHAAANAFAQLKDLSNQQPSAIALDISRLSLQNREQRCGSAICCHCKTFRGRY